MIYLHRKFKDFKLMKKLFTASVYISVLALLNYSCTRNNHFEKPEKLIPQEQMISILVDIHIADIIISDKSAVAKHSITKNKVPNNAVMQKYGITKEQFKENIKYYSSDLDNMKSIYNSVLDTLNTRLDTLQSGKK